ncbi:MAG: VCBS repeat-containing protein [Planctomycetota bacterium]|nr:VCBS repeat-containing protein [Planctomycetota bacterium]
MSYSFGIDAADLDGDGDLDLTGCDTRNFKLYWFENNGIGEFTEHLIEDGDRLQIFGDITGDAIAKATAGDDVSNRWFKTPRLERLMNGDVDGDGCIDVVIVENLFGSVYWYKNSGTPRDDSLWTKFTITNRAIPGAYDVALADFDGDGDSDVAVSTWRLSNKFVWFENPGDPENSAEWKLHLMEENIAEPRTVRIADFNGDGLPDLLGTALTANVVMWYENPGHSDAAKWTRHNIDDISLEPGHGMPADIDSDGDFDVVMALGMGRQNGENGTREIVWYENVGKPGDATTWRKRVIGDDVDEAFEAIAVDINGDGHVDVAATSYASPHGGVFWYENSGDANPKWNRHEVKANWPRANQIISADIDADGRPDLISGSTGSSSEIRWWRNIP